MKIKLIIQEELNRLLLEVTFESVKERFNSKKFLKTFGGNSKLASEQLLSTIPSDIEEKYKGVLLNWVVSWAIKNGTYDLPSDFKAAVEIYYQIKQQKLQRFLTKKSISQIESPEELVSIVNSAKPEYDKHNEKKFEKSTKGEGQDLVYEDSDWEIYIPETKGASCALGKGTEWCTAAPGLDYYNEYHSKENPLIIFISKSNPEDKYQFHYETEQFMNRDDRTISGRNIFYELNNLVKTKLKGKISKKSFKAANSYDFKILKNGGHMYLDPDERTWYNQNGHRHREDGPAIEYPDGQAAWYLNDRLHREDGPAIEHGTGDKHWYLNGKRHREDGPAIEHINGEKHWYLNDIRHREDGPAIERADGAKEWYLNDIRHREDGPAFEGVYGAKEWYLNGELHREDGPAVEYSNGDKRWYLNGERHREDGPAVERADGDKLWYLNGIRFPEARFNKKMKSRNLKEHFKRFL